LLFALLGGLAPAPARGQVTVSPEQVKAAYIYNFAHFAVWPAHAFDGPDDRFRVCVDGDLTSAPEIEATFLNEVISGRPITILRNPAPSDHRRCHILYVAGTARQVEALLKGVAGAPVMTIGDSGEFIARGGILAFALEGKHMRFDVNLRASAAAGVTLSSQLLQVARRVQR
jgi:hypothetical protein